MPPETRLTDPRLGHPTDAPPESGGAEEGQGPVSAEPSEHCVIVAGGLTTAMLAPMSLRSSSDPKQLTELEQQLLDLRDRLPADLHDDFTTLAHSVEAPPAGSGTFDEKAMRRAMEPVQDWLGRHCAQS